MLAGAGLGRAWPGKLVGMQVGADAGGGRAAGEGVAGEKGGGRGVVGEQLGEEGVEWQARERNYKSSETGGVPSTST